MRSRAYYLVVILLAGGGCGTGGSDDTCTLAQQHVMECGIEPDEIEDSLAKVCDDNLAMFGEIVLSKSCTELLNAPAINLDDGEKAEKTDWLDWIGIGTFNSINGAFGGRLSGFKNDWDGFAKWRKTDGQKAWNSTWSNVGKAIGNGWKTFTNPVAWRDAWNSSWKALGSARKSSGEGIMRFGDFVREPSNYFRWPPLGANTSSGSQKLGSKAFTITHWNTDAQKITNTDILHSSGWSVSQ